MVNCRVSIHLALFHAESVYMIPDLDLAACCAYEFSEFQLLCFRSFNCMTDNHTILCLSCVFMHYFDKNNHHPYSDYNNLLSSSY